jgi:alpha,alpha-trehalase
MYSTAKDTLYNFFSMVDDYGFIPNGARMYFLDRSQPPLLAEMVGLYYNITGDATMVLEAMPRLLAEHRFWMETDHLINITSDFSEGAKNRFTGSVLETALLNRYFANTTEPRPESWRESMLTMGMSTKVFASGKRLLRWTASRRGPVQKTGWEHPRTTTGLYGFWR